MRTQEPEAIPSLLRIQAVKPTAYGRSNRNSIRIFHQWSGIVQGTMLFVISLQRLAARDQTVVSIGQGERWKKSHRLPTTFAESASNTNPVVVFVVCLLAPSTVPDDRAQTVRTLTEKAPSPRRPVSFRAVLGGRRWDKEDHSRVWRLHVGRFILAVRHLEGFGAPREGC